MVGREALRLAKDMDKVNPHLVHGARRAVGVTASNPLQVGLPMEIDMWLSSGTGLIMGEAAQQSVIEEQLSTT